MADWIKEKSERIEKARGPFEELCLHRMSVDNGDMWRGGRLRVYEKVDKALRALREWRYANNQQNHTEDEVGLSIRTAAEAFATEIAEAAGSRQDPATIAWVVAGLRCPRRPFCTGCESCFTVDAPHRFDEAFTTTGSNLAGGTDA